MKQILTIYLLLFSILNGKGNNENYYFEKISPESGFAFDAIYTISEDCNGFIWFGCNNGLYYYNTNSIEKIDLYPENTGNFQSLKINQIFRDDDCTLWICTENGLFKYLDTSNQFEKINFLNDDVLENDNSSVEFFTQFNENEYLLTVNRQLYSLQKNDSVLTRIYFNPSLKEEPVSYLGKNKKGVIIIGTNFGNIYEGLSPNTEFLLFYNSQKGPVRTVCEDENKILIGFDSDGIDVLNLLGTKIYELNENLPGKSKILNNRVRQIVKRPNGDIWIGTYQGITILGQDKNIHLTNIEGVGLPSNSIYVLYQGRNDGIWVGTWSGGIAYYNDFNYHFRHIEKTPSEKKDLKNISSSFAEDGKGNVWVGAEQAGVSLFSLETKEFISLQNSPLSTDVNLIKSLTADNSGNLYIGTFDDGIWHYNSKTDQLKKLGKNFFNLGSIISTSELIDNELWFGTRSGGLYNYNTIDEQITYTNLDQIAHSKPSTNKIWNLLFDSAYNLWISTDEGLFLKNKNSDLYFKCLENDSLFNLNKTMIYTTCEGNNGQLWMGTKGKGALIYYLDGDSAGTFPGYETIKNTDVYGILKDKAQDIWFSTNQGIYKYSNIANSITRFTSLDGLSGEQYIPNSAYLCKNGELLFGSSNGFNIINPTIIKSNPFKPNIYLSKILINNKSLATFDDIKTNSYNVADIENLELKHDQNSITFGIITNNFIKPEKNKFRYRLLNYNEEWVEITQNKDVTFTKIPPGDYIFEVFGSNNDNLWSDTPLQIKIKVQAPFWLQWYAIIVYIMLIAGIAVMVLKELRIRFLLRKEILAERYKSEAQELLYSEKMKFFTNVSHEFRTPLTLIISPINNLMKKFQFDSKTLNHLIIIKRNSQRLLRLTNQILDFRLMEVGKLKTNIKKTDIIALSTEIYNCFELQIIEKQINFLFNSDFKSMWIYVDSDMIEKIIYNLISNALKFSEEKGQVIVSVEKKNLTAENFEGVFFVGNSFYGEAIEIKVKDFGKGINKELLPHIFERFAKDPDDAETGTGIGLNLSQEYARLNEGNIMVSSQVGEGSVFVLNLPVQKNQEFEKESIITQFPAEKTELEQFEFESKLSVNGNKRVILIAEDNDDLRSYLKDYLSNYFKVITAKNGKQAIEITTEVLPDIVITDILMPGLDGIELTQTIKNSPKTNHIPVIVLTALYESKYHMESILKGADVYLTKPIDESLLLAQIENVLNNREMMQKRMELKKEEKNSPTISGKDSLIESAEKIIAKNLQNTEFDIQNLSTYLNVSRSTLHRKIKKSTNQNPSEFIRDIRLNNALDLLKAGKFNIDEIGAYVGFNSTSYFIRSFKKKYGKTPKEYYSGINGNK